MVLLLVLSPLKVAGAMLHYVGEDLRLLCKPSLNNALTPSPNPMAATSWSR